MVHFTPFSVRRAQSLLIELLWVEGINWSEKIITDLMFALLMQVSMSDKKFLAKILFENIFPVAWMPSSFVLTSRLSSG